MKAAVQSRLPGAVVLLYGSVARGDQRADSDYDVLVITDEPLNPGVRDGVDDAIYDVQLKYGELIVASYLTRLDMDETPPSPYRLDIARGAIRL